MKLGLLSAKRLCFAIILASLTGCHMDGSSFRMDSNSRIPFFGVSFSKNSRTKNVEQGTVVRATNEGLDVRQSSHPAGTDYWRDSNDAPKRIPLKQTDLGDESLTAL